MKKAAKAKDGSTMRPEYDFSGAARGKYAGRFATGSNVVVLAPDLAKVFPDSESVNRALRALVEAARETVPKAKE